MIFDRSSSSSDPQVAISNRGAAPEDVILTLRDTSGMALGAALRTLQGKGTVRESLSSLFDMATGELPLSGYLESTSTQVHVSLIEGDVNPLTEVPGTTAFRSSRVIIPYFVFGGGINSTITLVNASGNLDGRVIVRPIAAGGVPLAPYEVPIDRLGRVAIDMNTVFGNSAMVSGHVILDVLRATPNPFGSVPLITGFVRVALGGASAVAPISGEVTTLAASFTPVVINASEYAGLAVTNTGGSSASVTVQVFGPGGALVGSGTLNVSASASNIKLIREIVPASVGVVNGHIRVTSSQPVSMAVYLGTATLTELAYVARQ
jgi:hypothetical protein